MSSGDSNQELGFSCPMYGRVDGGTHRVSGASNGSTTTSQGSASPRVYRRQTQPKGRISTRDRPLHWTHRDVALRELYRLKESLQAHQISGALTQASSNVQVTPGVGNFVSERAVSPRDAPNTGVSSQCSSSTGKLHYQSVETVFHYGLMDDSVKENDLTMSIDGALGCFQRSNTASPSQLPQPHASGQLPTLLADADVALPWWCGCHSDKAKFTNAHLRESPHGLPAPPSPISPQYLEATQPLHAPLSLGDIKPEEWRQEIIGGVPFPLWSRAQFLHSRGFRGWECVLPTCHSAQQAVLNVVNQMRAETPSLFVTDTRVVAAELQRLSDSGFCDADENIPLNDGSLLFDKAVASASHRLCPSCVLPAGPHIPT